ncbi:ABC-type zinc uptake system zinc chaperone [Shewanella sp. HL-SH5]|uniref:ABC-type zinc uptake system zinc chaperone n=1 Tax=Shewanella sp. HL-SH5 TaxID=3436241 RepID=UPI003EBB902D
MRFSLQLKQHIAIWLCAILMVLALAASNHSTEHHEDGVNSHHCTLCFHQHQLNKVLHAFSFSIPIQKKQYEVSVDVLPVFSSVSIFHYHSRGPPYTV